MNGVNPGGITDKKRAHEMAEASQRILNLRDLHESRVLLMQAAHRREIADLRERITRAIEALPVTVLTTEVVRTVIDRQDALAAIRDTE